MTPDSLVFFTALGSVAGFLLGLWLIRLLYEFLEGRRK